MAKSTQAVIRAGSVLFSALVLLRTAHAQIVLDQSARPNNPTQSDAIIVGLTGKNSVAADVAQTFTPAVSGTLASISVLIGQTGATQPLIVDIRHATGGTPQLANAPVLGSVTLQPSQVQNRFPAENSPYTSIDFSQFKIPVTAGDPLAIVMRSSQVADTFNNIWLWGSSLGDQDLNAGGSTWSRTGGTTNAWIPGSPTDQGFAEYVLIPEPASSLAILVFAPLFACRRLRGRIV